MTALLSVGTPVRERVGTLDRVRGLAVVLMVLDHTLVAAGVGSGPGRLTITRAALPLFLLTAGSLSVGRPSVRRAGQIGAAAVAATALGLVVGIGQPDILWLILGALALMPVGPWLAAGAAIQATTWPMGWSGYEPGVVLVLVVLGQHYGARPLDQLGRRLPEYLEAVGRRPLAWYLGHLAVLALAVTVA